MTDDPKLTCPLITVHDIMAVWPEVPKSVSSKWKVESGPVTAEMVEDALARFLAENPKNGAES